MKINDLLYFTEKGEGEIEWKKAHRKIDEIQYRKLAQGAEGWARRVLNNDLISIHNFHIVVAGCWAGNV